MKKIICYHEPAKLWSKENYHCYENHRYVAEQIKGYFERYGYSVFVCDAGNWKDQKTALELLDRGDVYFSLGTNAAGLDLYTDDGEGVYEKYDVPHIVIMADHPYLDRGNFFMNRFRNARCNNLFVWVSNDDMKCLALEELKSEIKVGFPATWGVTAEEFDDEQTRDIEVLYTGRLYENASPIRVWNHMELSESIKTIMNDVADYLECKAVSVYDGFEHILSAYYMKNYIRGLYPYFRYMLIYIMEWRRIKLVDTLVKSGIHLTMCDNSWKSYKDAKKMTILGTQYQETLALYKRAKILVADVAGCNSYIHGRIWDAARYGTAVISEYSSWMDKYFFTPGAMKGFHWDEVNELPSTIEYLLTNDDARIAMTKKTYNIIKENFTAEQFVKNLVTMVDLYLLSQK